jgi:hypothetical protein
VTGVDVIGESGWPAVLVGNLIGGVSLMSFLNVTSATTPIPWWTIFGESKVFKEGLVAGLVGAGTITLWFLIIEMGRGQPFFTPGALGSALFLGSSDPTAVIVSVATVAGYSIIHIGAFFMGLMALSAEFLLSALAWWAIVVGNVLATASMGYYLWAKHPKLREALAANPINKTA